MSERSEKLEEAINEFLGKVGIQHGSDLVNQFNPFNKYSMRSSKLFASTSICFV
jgi:hypothetical protein